MGLFDRPPGQRQTWVATRWSVLSTLARREDPAWEASWLYLVSTYRQPMEQYVRRVLTRSGRRTTAAEDAAEIVQDFLTTCVEKDWLSHADQDRGRFRAYVRTLLRRYTQKRLRHESAQKRSPPRGVQTFSILDDDALDEISPEERAELEEFDRSWVKIAVDRSLERLKDEHARHHAVVLDLIATDGEGSEDLAERVYIRPKQVPVVKHRARKQFLAIFEEELSATVASEEAFEEEWRTLAPYLPGNARAARRR